MMVQMIAILLLLMNSMASATMINYDSADVVIAVENVVRIQSASQVGDTDTIEMAEWIGQASSQLQVKENQMNVGVVRVGSSDVVVMMPSKDGTAWKKVEDEIKRIGKVEEGKPAMAEGTAVEKIRQTTFKEADGDRPGIPNIIVFVTPIADQKSMITIPGVDLNIAVSYERPDMQANLVADIGGKLEPRPPSDAAQMIRDILALCPYDESLAECNYDAKKRCVQSARRIGKPPREKDRKYCLDDSTVSCDKGEDGCKHSGKEAGKGGRSNSGGGGGGGGLPKWLLGIIVGLIVLALIVVGVLIGIFLVVKPRRQRAHHHRLMALQRKRTGVDGESKTAPSVTYTRVSLVSTATNFSATTQTRTTKMDRSLGRGKTSRAKESRADTQMTTTREASKKQLKSEKRTNTIQAKQ